MANDAREPVRDPCGVADGQLVLPFSPLPTGTKLAGLKVLSVLGAGAFGITYVGEDEASGGLLVIKEYMPRAIARRGGLAIIPSPGSEPVFSLGLGLFLKEGAALARIRHPSVVAVQSVSEENGTGYVVMANEPGSDLGIWLSSLRRTPSQAEHDRLIGPLLEGLAALHANGVRHLEITPANILMRQDGTLVLLDFGGVRHAMRRRLGLPPLAASKPFIAPEVLTDETSAGPDSDIYSMAAVLYLTTTGLSPFAADERVPRDARVPAALAAKDKYRASFLTAIDVGLNRVREDRPQSVSAWRADLLSLGRTVHSRRDTTAGSPGHQSDITSPEGKAATEDNAEFEGAGQNVGLMHRAGLWSVLFGAVGLATGALAGALASMVIAIIANPGCYAYVCAVPILPFTMVTGALAGAWLGVKYRTSN